MTTRNSPLKDRHRIARTLLDWYAVHRRDLPWRNTQDPYCIWISEIMLQQTQVTTVIPYYERFLTRFPTVESLAAGDLSEVLALWQGLGYYSRARNLHQAARVVVTCHRGALPTTETELRHLPGVGVYTAGAILSIAHNKNAVAIDANATRILARLMNYDKEISRAASKRAISRFATDLLPSGRAREFNQAVMDLGATVCVARNPLCQDCPLQAYCQAFALGTQEERPVRRARAIPPTIAMVAAHIVNPDGSWLSVRRKPSGLLGGLWELPSFELPDSDRDAETVLCHGLQKDFGLDLFRSHQRLIVSHAYSHFRINVTVYECRIQGSPRLDGHETWDALHWMAQEDLQDYGLTGVTVKILDRIAQGQLSLF